MNLISLDHIGIGKVISGFEVCPSEELLCKYYPTFEGSIEEEIEVPRISKLVDKIFSLSPKKVFKLKKDKFSAIIQLDTEDNPIVLDNRSIIPGEKTSVKCPRYSYIHLGTACLYDIVPVKVSSHELCDNFGRYYKLYRYPYISLQFSGKKIKDWETKRYYFDNSKDMLDFLKYLFNKKYLNPESIFTSSSVNCKKVDIDKIEEMVIDIFKEFDEKE